MRNIMRKPAKLLLGLAILAIMGVLFSPNLGNTASCTITTPAYSTTISSIIPVAGTNTPDYTFSVKCDAGTSYGVYSTFNGRISLSTSAPVKSIYYYFYRNPARASTDEIKSSSSPAYYIATGRTGNGSDQYYTIYTRAVGNSTAGCSTVGAYYTCTNGTYTGLAGLKVTF
jgi:hypothetical protein